MSLPVAWKKDSHDGLLELEEEVSWRDEERQKQHDQSRVAEADVNPWGWVGLGIRLQVHFG